MALRNELHKHLTIERILKCFDPVLKRNLGTQSNCLQVSTLKIYLLCYERELLFLDSNGFYFLC